MTRSTIQNEQHGFWSERGITKSCGTVAANPRAELHIHFIRARLRITCTKQPLLSHKEAVRTIFKPGLHFKIKSARLSLPSNNTTPLQGNTASWRCVSCFTIVCTTLWSVIFISSCFLKSAYEIFNLKPFGALNRGRNATENASRLRCLYLGRDVSNPLEHKNSVTGIKKRVCTKKQSAHRILKEHCFLNRLLKPLMSRLKTSQRWHGLGTWDKYMNNSFLTGLLFTMIIAELNRLCCWLRFFAYPHNKQKFGVLICIYIYLQLSGKSATMHSFWVQSNAAARKQGNNKKGSGMEAQILLPTLISHISFPWCSLIRRKPLAGNQSINLWPGGERVWGNSLGEEIRGS